MFHFLFFSLQKIEFTLTRVQIAILQGINAVEHVAQFSGNQPFSLGNIEQYAIYRTNLHKETLSNWFVEIYAVSTKYVPMAFRFSWDMYISYRTTDYLKQRKCLVNRCLYRSHSYHFDHNFRIEHLFVAGAWTKLLNK